jgi:hypothetical protein
MSYKNIVYVGIVLLLIACGGSQKATENAVATAAATKIIKSHNAAALSFTTLQSRLGVKYKDEKRSQSVTVDLRMKKGEKIWMSARVLGFTVAKVYITPDRVRFYEKLNKRFFDGDFKLISEFLGEELTFQQIEDLMLGQAIEPLTGMQYDIVNNEYQFRMGGIIEKLFSLRPNDFKVSQQSIRKSSEDTTLDIRYPEYQIVDSKVLPQAVDVNANQAGKQVRVQLQFNNVEFDQDLSFPFEMPANYRTFSF